MRGLIITPRAQNWIENGRPARILHIFDQVLNLVDGSGAVLSLLTPHIPIGPFSLILEENFQVRIPQIRIQDPVTIKPAQKTLQVGSLEITTAAAQSWNPVPDWSQLKNEALLDQPIPDHLPMEIDSLYRRLLDCIFSDDRENGRPVVKALGGLGGGLTPAGDDVLMGLLFAFWVWAPQSEWIQAVVDWAAPRTTSLSAAYLQAAGNGEATIHWHDIVAGQPGAVDRLLAIGHTSGKDAWVGFLQANHRFHRSKSDF